MEPEVRERFERIEATLALTAENQRRSMEGFDKRQEEFERELNASRAEFDRRHQVYMSEFARMSEEAEKRHKAAMARMDRMDAKSDEKFRRLSLNCNFGRG